MRSYITDLLRFALFAVPVYIAFIVVAGSIAPYHDFRNIKYFRGGPGHLLTRLQEADTTGPVDILFMGSSHTYRGFDMRIFRAAGYTCFNLGSSGQSPLQTEVLFDRYIEQLDPQLIILDILPTNYNSLSIEPCIDFLSNSKIGKNEILMSLKYKNISIVNTLLFAMFKSTFREERTNTIISNRKEKYIAGGYVEKTEDIPFKPRTEAIKLEWPPPSAQWEAFIRFVSKVRSRGIELVLVQTPVTRTWQYGPTDQAKLEETFAPWGTAFINMSAALPGSEPDLFYDGNHMRHTSVERFNTMFLDSLAARNLLPTR
jgi:hypothetical protein